MSLLHFNPELARELARTVSHQAATLSPSAVISGNDDDFTASLCGAVDRLNHQCAHLAEYLRQVAENSAAIADKAEYADATLGRSFDDAEVPS